MQTGSFISYLLLVAIIIYYLVYTYRYAIVFKKSNFYTGRKKTFHSIMIWLFPFAWIWILKFIVKPVPGSHTFKNKREPYNMNGYLDSGVSDSGPGLGHDGNGHSH